MKGAVVTTILISGTPASWVTYPQAVPAAPSSLTGPTTSAVAPEFRTTSEPSWVTSFVLATGHTTPPEFA